MKILLSCVLILGLMGGCAGLSKEQQERIEVITKKNETLAGELSTLYTQARQGLADPAEIVAAIQKVTAAMSENHAEIKKIQAESGNTSAWIAGAVGLFGRTALHAVGAAIPGAGPLAAGLQAILTLLLGGSTTKKREA